MFNSACTRDGELEFQSMYGDAWLYVDVQVCVYKYYMYIYIYNYIYTCMYMHDVYIEICI